MRRIFAAAALLTIAGCGPAPTRETTPVPLAPAPPPVPAFRLHPPAPIATPHFSPPQTRAFDLPNGLRVRVVYRDGPLCSLRVRLLTDAIDKPATLAIMAAELKAGTKAHPAGAFTQAMNALGAQLDVYVFPESVDLVSTFPPDVMEGMIGLTAEALLTPTFQKPSFEGQRKYKASYADATWKLPASAADSVLQRTLFGADHPYGHLTPSATELRGVVYEDMLATHASLLDARRIIVAAGGACGETALRPALERAFGGVARARTPVASMAAPAFATRRLVVVDSPGALEVEIAVGVPGASAMSNDWYTELVMNQVMRQRATERIQHQLGLTDNWWVSTLGYGAAGGTAIRASARKEKLSTLLAELESLLVRAAHVDDAEVAEARSRILLQDAGSFERARDITVGLAGLAQYGPDAEGFTRLRSEVGHATAPSLASYSGKYIAKARTVAVVVGDLAAMRPELLALGWDRIEQADASGALVTTIR